MSRARKTKKNAFPPAKWPKSWTLIVLQQGGAHSVTVPWPESATGKSCSVLFKAVAARACVGAGALETYLLVLRFVSVSYTHLTLPTKA